MFDVFVGYSVSSDNVAAFLVCVATAHSTSLVFNCKVCRHVQRVLHSENTPTELLEKTGLFLSTQIIRNLVSIQVYVMKSSAPIKQHFIMSPHCAVWYH